MKMSYEILSAALKELGNDNTNDRYLAGGYNWCSEFVSYVYMRAGYPFTDGSFSQRIKIEGDDGSWMQRTSTRIVDWFKKNKTYIHRESKGWWDYQPKAGDFLLIGRYGSDRLHSGIVEFESGHTLYTIEGNNSGRKVMRFSYPYYKINDEDNGEANGIILGIGVI